MRPADQSQGRQARQALPGQTFRRPCLGLALLLVLALLTAGEQLAGPIQKRQLPRAHLDGMSRVIGGDLLDRLAATDCLHGDPGLELGAMGQAFVCSSVGAPVRGRTPPQRLTIGPAQKSQITSVYKWLARFRSGGAASLADRRSVRRTQRRTLDPQQQQHAVELRHQRLHLRHIARMLGAPFSTVARALNRLGLG